MIKQIFLVALLMIGLVGAYIVNFGETKQAVAVDKTELSCGCGNNCGCGCKQSGICGCQK